jgi:hypothetical protein
MPVKGTYGSRGETKVSPAPPSFKKGIPKYTRYFIRGGRQTEPKFKGGILREP